MENPLKPIFEPRPGRIAIFFTSTGRGSFMGERGIGMEEWKNYNESYEVSNLGRVRHVKHKKILKQGICGNGRPQVRVPKSTCVSVLVAKSFFGPRPKGYEVHHKDLNPLNNNIENLEYLIRSSHRTLHHPIENRCLVCGKRITKGRITCSRTCMHIIKFTKRICKYCGKEFEVSKKIITLRGKEKRYKNGIGIFCSAICRNMGRTRSASGLFLPRKDR